MAHANALLVPRWRIGLGLAFRYLDHVAMVSICWDRAVPRVDFVMPARTTAAMPIEPTGPDSKPVEAPLS